MFPHRDQYLTNETNLLQVNSESSKYGVPTGPHSGLLTLLTQLAFRDSHAHKLLDINPFKCFSYPPAIFALIAMQVYLLFGEFVNFYLTQNANYHRFKNGVKQQRKRNSSIIFMGT